jgi:hypothetical protein
LGTSSRCSNTSPPGHPVVGRVPAVATQRAGFWANDSSSEGVITQSGRPRSSVTYAY